MTTATIALLGRATPAAEFILLWTGTAQVGDDTVLVRPAVPPAAAGHELVVDVLASSGSPNFGFFREVPGEPAAGADAGAAPPARRLVPAGTAYFAAGRIKARRVPFGGSVVALCRVGRPQPAA